VVQIGPFAYIITIFFEEEVLLATHRLMQHPSRICRSQLKATEAPPANKEYQFSAVVAGFKQLEVVLNMIRPGMDLPDSYQAQCSRPRCRIIVSFSTSTTALYAASQGIQVRPLVSGSVACS
jgi:hypothetical protein